MWPHSHHGLICCRKASGLILGVVEYLNSTLLGLASLPVEMRPPSPGSVGGQRGPRPASWPSISSLADVEVTGMSRGLLDHVQHDPAHVRRFVHLRVAVPAAWRRRQRVTPPAPHPSARTGHGRSR